jgi:hypothetical protein
MDVEGFKVLSMAGCIRGGITEYPTQKKKGGIQKD